VSGPLWYAAGATVQILLFATVAIELKRRAPHAHVSAIRSQPGIRSDHVIDVSRSCARSLWKGHSFRIHHFRPFHQHTRHSYVADRRICCHQLFDWRAYGSSLFSPSSGSRNLHDVWWDQGHLPDGLCPHCYSSCNSSDLCLHHVRHWRPAWLHKSGLRASAGAFSDGTCSR
jgi:hypothetical protein